MIGTATRPLATEAVAQTPFVDAAAHYRNDPEQGFLIFREIAFGGGYTIGGWRCQGAHAARVGVILITIRTRVQSDPRIFRVRALLISDRILLNIHGTPSRGTMTLLFNEAKATQAAAHILHLRGGSMSYVKLIKLLYLADREALIRWGRPITTDRYVSLDIGPVVNRVYELIRGEPAPNSMWIWRKFISAPENY